MSTEHTQDEITPSADYIKGFNEGYIMAKFNPNFSRGDMKQTDSSDRSKGFEKGMMQYEVEKKFDKALPSLSKDRADKGIKRDSRSNNKDIERD